MPNGNAIPGIQVQLVCAKARTCHCLQTRWGPRMANVEHKQMPWNERTPLHGERAQPGVVPDEGAFPEELPLPQLSQGLGVGPLQHMDLAGLDNVELAADVALPEDGLPILEVQRVQRICQKIPVFLDVRVFIWSALGLTVSE